MSGCDGSSPGSTVDRSDCDRQCIVDLTDRYIDALIRNDTGAAPLADHAVLVENLRPTDTEQGQWQQALRGPVSFAVHVPDPAAGQAGWMGVVNAADKPIVLAIRLRFDGKRVVEAEHLFADLGDLTQSDIGTLYPALQSEVAPADRLDRGELIRIGASYYNALDGNDGSLSPFAPDCKRIENGVLTAGEGAASTPQFDTYRPGVAHDCRSQIDSQAFVFIDKIEGRRMVAADPHTGLVMGFSRFRHSMENLPYKVTLNDGSTVQVDRESLPLEPFDLAAAHIFKIGPEGTITSISAVGIMAPYGADSAWD